jgi:acyl-homoserine-lactone acylase
MKILSILLFLWPCVLIGQSIDPNNIEIIRDQWGVPHIYAPTDAEVAYGLAWAHAEDDFYNIQLTLTASKQLLGSYLGKDGAAADFMVGLLNCEQVVEKYYHTLGADYIKVLEGYVQGLNAYALSHKKEVLVKKAFPVTPKEALRGYVLQLAVMAGAGDVVTDILDDEVDPIFKGIGSNAFAINRTKTSDGHVYLAVNSHQPLEGPAAWYEAHLVSDEGWNTLGGLFPGAATILHGTNEKLGWAHTVNYPDKIDLYQLEMNNEEPMQYRVDQEWKELAEEKLKLKVKVFPGVRISVKKKVYRSIYGPTLKNKTGYFAFDMSALHGIHAAEQWYLMNKANNWMEFKEALEILGIPGFNIVYADVDGNIFYVGNAKMPFRSEDYEWGEVLPGNTTKTLHSDYHPFSDLPQVLNPSCGYVFNTNHSAFISTGKEDWLNMDEYDHTMGYKLWNNNRSLRFTELIESYDKLNWEDFLRIKYDNQLPDSLGYLIDVNELFRIEPDDLPNSSELLRIIQRWNRQSDSDDVGPAQFMILYDFLKEIVNAPKSAIYQPSRDELIMALEKSHDFLMKHYGQLDITLGEYQFLIRSQIKKPVWGISDVITAMHSNRGKNGRAKAVAGESYIMIVRYPKDSLPIIETVNVFGASNRPDSPHYDDQMDMFLQKQRKSMTLDIEEVRENATSIYHPGT